MEICVRDELIKVPGYVLKKIPFLRTLNFAIQSDKIPKTTMNENTLTIDSLSPRFLKIIIDYSKNDYGNDLLVRLLYGQFSNDIIKQNLGYLCLEELYNNLYLRRYGISTNRQIVIKDVFVFEHPGETHYTAKLLNDTKIELGKISRAWGYSYTQQLQFFTIYLNIYDTEIFLTKNEADSITDGLKKIGDICLMNFETYIKHAHLKYHDELSMFDHKNNKYMTMTVLVDNRVKGISQYEIDFNEFNRMDLPFSLKNLKNENYLPDVRTIMTREELIQIPKYVIDKIPYVEEKMREQDHTINLDEIPPRFMKFIVTFINNDLSPDYVLKKIRKVYEPERISHYLQCIGMSDLIK